MLQSFHLHFTKDQLGVVFNSAELHKAHHVLHHWRLEHIPMFSSHVQYADKETLANCQLYNHPFPSLYEIKEKGGEETAFFAAATRKHQTRAGRVIGDVGAAATFTMLRDAFCPLL